MRSFVVALTLAFICAPVANSQPAGEMGQQIAAMEYTVFAKTYCKDTPIRRIQRLEENFSEPSKQKDKDLQTRLDELMAKVKPTAEALSRPDPCATTATKRGPKSLLGGLMADHQPDGSWKQRQYPFIEWTGKPIESVEKGVAQLKTDGAANGRIKYVLTVKLPEGIYPHYYTVTFLDEHGFKLNKFVVNGPSFERAEGADGGALWQAKDQAIMPEKDYKQARDYTVTAGF